MKHKNQKPTARRFFYSVEAPLEPGQLTPKVGVYQLNQPNAALFHAIGGQGPKIHAGSFISPDRDPVTAYQVVANNSAGLVAEDLEGIRVHLNPASFAADGWHVSTVPALVATLGRQTVVTYTHEDGRVEVLTGPDYREPAAVVLNWPKMAGKVFRLAEVPADRQKVHAPLLEGVLQHTTTAALECGPGDGIPVDQWLANFRRQFPDLQQVEVGKGRTPREEFLEDYAAGVRAFIEQRGPVDCSEDFSPEEDATDAEDFEQRQAWEGYCHEMENQGLEALDYADWLDQRGEDREGLPEGRQRVLTIRMNSGDHQRFEIAPGASVVQFDFSFKTADWRNLVTVRLSNGQFLQASVHAQDLVLGFTIWPDAEAPEVLEYLDGFRDMLKTKDEWLARNRAEGEPGADPCRSV